MVNIPSRKLYWIPNPSAWERAVAWRERQRAARASFENINTGVVEALASARNSMVTGAGDLALQMAADRIKANSKSTALSDQLRTLVAVVKTGSNTGAAKELNMRESDVSKDLAKLEAQVGRPIFVRGASTMTLTADGQKLYYYALNNPNGAQTSA